MCSENDEIRRDMSVNTAGLVLDVGVQSNVAKTPKARFTWRVAALLSHASWSFETVVVAASHLLNSTSTTKQVSAHNLLMLIVTNIFLKLQIWSPNSHMMSLT